MIDLLSVLHTKGVLADEDVAEVRAQLQQSDTTVEDVLISRGIPAHDILEAKGEYWNMPVRSIDTALSIPFEVLQYIPEASAKHYQVAPLAFVDNVLEVGIVDPDNIEALDALNFISTKKGIPFKLFLISPASWQEAMHSYRGISSDVSQALTQMVGDQDEEQGGVDISNEKEVQELDNLEQTVQAAEKKGGGDGMHEDAPITKIVATVLRNAIEARASDIHVEPERDRVRVRFRVDGELSQSLVLPSQVKRAVIARIKILAGIKLDERRKPQDGRFSATISGRRVDFRVSTFPTYFGEKAVLRILDSERGAITLEELGMDEEQLQTVRRLIDVPYGMILITGPTGSGKSTSLYAMLNEVDKNAQNVLSLEDPVEYNIPGVSQSQVRPEIGYSFASGIRSVLRQDPDIIMVGEIRDKETAQLAIQAALTGHLVFSTLHTNNAAGAIPRLVDMGVDPYLLAPTLQLIIAQRLVRKLCPDTGRAITVSGPVQRMIDESFADLPEQYHKKLPKTETILGIQPTTSCPLGTRGRIGVFEMLEVTDHLKEVILEKSDEKTIFDIARQKGMTTLREDAMIKALRHQIPFEEIAQVGASIDLEEEEERADVPIESDAGSQAPAQDDEVVHSQPSQDII